MTRQGHGHTPHPISEDSSSPGPSYRLETASNIQFPDQNDEPSICDRIKAFFHQLPNRQTEALVIGQTFYWMNTKFVYFFLLVHMTKDIQISHLTIGALVLFVKIFEAFLSLGLRCMQPRIKIKFYGSRKMQHGIGAVCSMVTLPLLFSSCSWFREPFSGVVRRDIFYFFMMLFYFLGVRIVGLMLELLQKSHWKVKLDSPRQSIQKWSMLNECFTDLLLFATIWLVLAIHSNKKIESNELLSIALTIMVFGIIFNILFHCIFNENHKATKHDQEDVEVIETNHEHGDETTKEKEELNNPSNDDEIPYHLARILLSKKEDISFNRILKDKEFWIRSILYIGTRCLVLVIYFYLVLYLIDSLQTSKVWIGGLLFWYIATYWLFKAVVHFMIQVLGTHICWFIGYTAIIGFSLLCGTLKPETHLTMFVTLLFLSIGINFLTEISLNWLKEYYGEGKVIEIALKEKEKKKHITLSLCEWMENISIAVFVFLIQAFIHTKYHRQSATCGKDEIILSYRYILAILPTLISTILLGIICKYVKLENPASKGNSTKSTPEKHKSQAISDEISQRLDLEEELQKSKYPDLDYIGMKLALPRIPSPIHTKV